MALVLILLLAGTIYLVVGALRQPGTARNADGQSQVNPKPTQAAQALDAGLDAAAKYQAQGQFAEAVAILAKLAEQAPADQRVRLAWAQALLGQKEAPKAYEQYQAALSLENNASIKSGGINPKLAQIHGEAGTCASMANLLDRAVEHFSMAQTADPTNPRYPMFLAMVQLKLGGSENESSAMANLVRATLIQPDLGEAWGTMAEIELNRNHTDLAAQHLEKALKCQPDQHKWRIAQARIFNRQGSPDKAITVISTLDAATRATKPVLQLTGESYGLLKKPAEAASMYEQAAKATPTDPELWYQAALWRQRAGEPEKARKSAQTAAMLGSEPAKELVQALDNP